MELDVFLFVLRTNHRDVGDRNQSTWKIVCISSCRCDCRTQKRLLSNAIYHLVAEFVLHSVAALQSPVAVVIVYVWMNSDFPRFSKKIYFHFIFLFWFCFARFIRTWGERISLWQWNKNRKTFEKKNQNTHSLWSRISLWHCRRRRFSHCTEFSLHSIRCVFFSFWLIFVLNDEETRQSILLKLNYLFCLLFSFAAPSLSDFHSLRWIFYLSLVSSIVPQWLLGVEEWEREHETRWN